MKLVSFDMDGTFLNSQNDYDRSRFARVFQALQARGVKVVANSGNQYHQIKEFFSDYLDQMTIVSEIGSKIHENGTCIAAYHFDRAVVEAILDVLEEHNLLSRCSVSGLDTVYFEKTAPEDFKVIIKKHNGRWQEIDSLRQLPEDDFCIITLDLPDEDIPSLVAQLNRVSGSQARAVASGFNFVDIVLPQQNKATALSLLAERWDIAPSQMLAFGDSDNDLEMLAYVGHSYAMANSPQAVKDVARYQAPTNDASGVLVILEEWLERED